MIFNVRASALRVCCELGPTWLHREIIGEHKRPLKGLDVFGFGRDLTSVPWYAPWCLTPPVTFGLSMHLTEFMVSQVFRPWLFATPLGLVGYGQASRCFGMCLGAFGVRCHIGLRFVVLRWLGMCLVISWGLTCDLRAAARTS